MGIFSNFLGIEDEEDDLENEPSKEAKEIILVPNKFDITIKMSKEDLLEILRGRNIAVGSVVWERELTDEDMISNDFNDIIEDTFFRLKLVVKETSPKGIVRVTKKTKIILEQKEATTEDIPNEKIIEVVELPNIKDYIKIKDLRDLIKLGLGENFINKFQKNGKTVYFCKPYYFEE